MATVLLRSTRNKPRGAVSKAPLKPSRQWQLRMNWAWLKPSLLAASVVAVVWVAHQLWLGLVSMPIDRVGVAGDLNHVDRESLVERVQPLLVDGFVFVDLAAIRRSVVELPWVFDAAVTRQWPDKIEIRITEQKPIAQWSTKGYLNHRGEFFPSAMMKDLAPLPLLSGDESQMQRVMENFGAFSAALRGQNLQLAALAVDDRGNWRAEISGGATIVLGGDQVMEKIQRFIRAYQLELSSKFDAVAKIDMRYSNGFAVAWRTDTQQDQSRG